MPNGFFERAVAAVISDWHNPGKMEDEIPVFTLLANLHLTDKHRLALIVNRHDNSIHAYTTSVKVKKAFVGNSRSYPKSGEAVYFGKPIKVEEVGWKLKQVDEVDDFNEGNTGTQGYERDGSL